MQGRRYLADPVEYRGRARAQQVAAVAQAGGDPDRALDDELGRVRAWAGGELHVWGDAERTATALVLAQRAAEIVSELAGIRVGDVSLRKAALAKADGK